MIYITSLVSMYICYKYIVLYVYVDWSVYIHAYVRVCLYIYTPLFEYFINAYMNTYIDTFHICMYESIGVCVQVCMYV